MSILFGSVLPKRRRARMRTGHVDVIPFGRPNSSLPPRPVLMRQMLVTPPTPTRVVEQQVQSANGLHAAGQAPVAAPPMVRAEYPPLRLEVGGSVDGGTIAVPDYRTSTVRVQLPPAHDGTLQFLPGRLEIIEGSESGHEVRFVKTPGPDGTAVTFGRSEGPTYRHVTLNAATVSRQHARMTQEGKEWRLFSLSKTNPVVLNGRPMEGESDSTLLNDGDRVEMGEIVFRYHSR